jgi:large subunit ribosomal protein L15
MPHKLRKIRKKRGSRTQGYGRVGQHRKSGGRGGRGQAGMHKHMWSYVQKYDPNHFKKKRFKSITQTEPNIINLKQLEEIVAQLQKVKKGKVAVDLKEMGYSRLLGTGKISMPVSVKVPSCSEAAKTKIEEADGEVITEAT